jgi:hypothetical protein
LGLKSLPEYERNISEDLINGDEMINLIENRKDVEDSCRQDFIAFFKLLARIPDIREDHISSLLLNRKLILWIQSVRNCLLRGLYKFELMSKNYLRYWEKVSDRVGDVRKNIELKNMVPCIMKDIAHLLGLQLMRGGGRLTDSLGNLTEIFGCEINGSEFFDLKKWVEEMKTIKRTIIDIDSLYEDLNSYLEVNNKKREEWILTRDIWRKGYLNICENLLDELTPPKGSCDLSDESLDADESSDRGRRLINTVDEAEVSDMDVEEKESISESTDNDNDADFEESSAQNAFNERRKKRKRVKDYVKGIADKNAGVYDLIEKRVLVVMKRDDISDEELSDEDISSSKVITMNSNEFRKMRERVIAEVSEAVREYYQV